MILVSQGAQSLQSSQSVAAVPPNEKWRGRQGRRREGFACGENRGGGKRREKKEGRDAGGIWGVPWRNRGNGRWSGMKVKNSSDDDHFELLRLHPQKEKENVETEKEGVKVMKKTKRYNRYCRRGRWDTRERKKTRKTRKKYRKNNNRRIETSVICRGCSILRTNLSLW